MTNVDKPQPANTGGLLAPPWNKFCECLASMLYLIATLRSVTKLLESHSNMICMQTHTSMEFGTLNDRAFSLVFLCQIFVKLVN